MKRIFIYITLIGLVLTACKKDETRVVMSSSPTPPVINTLPNLTLTRATGTNTLVFTGTPVNPGFVASAMYYLEACKSGTKFADPVVVWTGSNVSEMKVTVSDLNGILIKKFPADQTSSVDFRLRSVLNIDAGTGYKPMVYISDTKTANVGIYGLPRLDLVNSGLTQKIESALGNGVYSGIVKLDAAKPFTLKDPDAGTVYGASGTALAVNGAGITAGTSGWYQLDVDTKALTYKLTSYMIGLVGSATPNGWDTPDQKMDYDAATGTWKIKVTLVDGEFKFRLNDGWAWNLGWNKDKTALTHNGDNIAATAGNYTITLTITKFAAPEEGTFTIVKN